MCPVCEEHVFQHSPMKLLVGWWLALDHAESGQIQDIRTAFSNWIDCIKRPSRSARQLTEQVQELATPQWVYRAPSTQQVSLRRPGQAQRQIQRKPRRRLRRLIRRHLHRCVQLPVRLRARLRARLRSRLRSHQQVNSKLLT